LSINGAAEINIGERNRFRDNDYFKFNVTEPGIVTVSVFQVPSNVELDVFMYKPAPEQTEVVRAVNNERGQGYTFEISTCLPGEHFLLFRDGNGNSANNPGNGFNSQQQYSFQVDFIPFSPIEDCECDNFSFQRVCEINQCDTVRAYISPHFNYVQRDVDNDVYEFELEANKKVSIVVQSVPSNVSICAELYDGSQNRLARYSLDDGETLDVDFTPTQDGKYYLTVDDCDGHFNSRDTYEVIVGCNLSTSINQVNLKEVATIFPNPVSQSFQIKSELLTGKTIILELYDIQGKVVKTKNTPFFNNLEIDISDLRNGFYALKLISENVNYNSKIIKIK